MEKFRKNVALLLAVVMMVVSTQIQAFATTNDKATQSVTGDITLSVVFGYNVSRNKLDSFEMGLELASKTDVNSSSNVKETGTPNGLKEKGLETVAFEKDGNSTIQISMKNKALDTYKLSLSSNGYKTYTEDIELKNNNKHIVLYTDGKDFTSGDFNKDGKVDEKDIKKLESELNTNNKDYDLNGDGNVDIVELSQVYWGATATKPAEIKNTSVIMENIIKPEEVKENFEKENKDTGVTIKEGNIGDLFNSNEKTEAVKFEAKEKITEKNPIKIPVISNKEDNKPEEAIKISNVVIKSPEGGAPKGGYVVYTDTNNKTEKVAFGTAKENQKVVSTDANTIMLAMADEKATKSSGNTIVINIGNQVPIQKITIEVTDVNDGLYASISKIEFLEDVLEDSINQEQSIIKGFSGTPKDGSVQLSWGRLPNISGYEVSYGMEKGVYTNTKPIKTPNETSTTITGLENDTPYYFAVRATGEDNYKGPFSDEITLTPVAQKPPGAPSNLEVESLDKALKVTFMKGNETKTSNIYYREKDNGDYTKIEADTGHIIRGLKNDITYEVYVTGSNEAGESSATRTIEQTPREYKIVAPAKVPTHKEISKDKFTIKPLRDNLNTGEYPEGFKIENLTDKDYNTHYTSRTINVDRGVSVTFNEPTEMDYLAYVTRLDKDKNGKFYSSYAKDYMVDIWTDDATKNKPDIRLKRQSIPIKNTTGDNNGLMILPLKGVLEMPEGANEKINGKVTVKKMDIYLYEDRWYEGGPGATTISEIMFYEYDSVIDDLTNLFNDSFTELKPGVTKDEVASIDNRIKNIVENSYLMINEKIVEDEIDVANEILDKNGVNTVRNKGNVIDVEQDRKHSSEDGKQIAMNLSDLQPIGATSGQGNTIIVYADFDEKLGVPELVFTQATGEHGQYTSNYKLKKGRNIIVTPNADNKKYGGGSIYVRYNGEEQPKGIKINVRGEDLGMIKVPMLDIKSTDDETEILKKSKKYVDILSKYVRESLNGHYNGYEDITEISLPNVLLSGTAKEVNNAIKNLGLTDKQQAIKNMVLAWDKNMELYYNLLGFEKGDANTIHQPPKTRPNIRVMSIPSGIFMYATSGHIGVPIGSVGGVINETINSPDGLFGWGINHELGHALNNNSYVIAEITNNIFPLYSQTINGGRSRLEPTVDGGTDGRYENNIYKKVTSGETGFVADTWTTLGMFWQLHLGLDNAPSTSITDFYSKLHRAYREDNNQENLSKWDRFMKLSSKAAQKDLTEFFKAWGLIPESETVKQEMGKYPVLDKKIQYVNDDAYRYMKERKPSVADSFVPSVDAKVVKQKDAQGIEIQDNVVELTMPELKEGILGYEIIRKDKTEKVIGFTTQNKFIDDTVLNNISYEYKVVAYDKTLKPSATSNAAEVRIDIEEVFIPKENYEFAKAEDGTITITKSDKLAYNEVLETIGIKFKNNLADAQNKYKIKVITRVEENGTIVEKEVIAKDSTNPTGNVYFNKPGADDKDMRLWTYATEKIIIEGANSINSKDDIELLEYPGDTVSFIIEDGMPAIGKITHDYREIKAGDIVMVGNYTGHPVNNKIVLSKEYVPLDIYDEKPKVFEEAVNGIMYILGEVPADKQVTKVASGIWIFKVEIKQDKNQNKNKGEHNHQNTTPALPQKVKANIFRQDYDPTSPEGGRLISDTPWVFVPEELPNITLISTQPDTVKPEAEQQQTP